MRIPRVSHRWWALVLLGAVLDGAGAAAAQPARRLPILVGLLAIDQGKPGERSKGNAKAARVCTPDWEMPTAIKKTLGQMGEEVQDWPTAVPLEQCVGIACATRLRSAVHEGYLLGGQISTRRLGPAHLDLWLIDLAARRIMLAQHDCLGCDKPEQVARHAASIVQRRAEIQAPWYPLSELATCAPRAEALVGVQSFEQSKASESPEQQEPSRPPILLAVYGAKAPTRLRQSIAQGTRQYLELLGQSVQEFRAPIDAEAPRSSLRPQQQGSRLLDIELQGAGGKMTEVLLRLSDAQDTRQTTLQCGNAQDCTPAALVQQVRLHVGALVDQLDAPAQVAVDAGAVELCVPAPVCVADLTRPTAVAPLPSPPPPRPTVTPTTDEPPSEAAGTKATDPVPNLAPPRMLALCPPPSRWRKLKLGGWTLIGLGGALVAAAIIPSVSSSVAGRCKHDDDGTDAQLCKTPPQPALNLLPLAATGYTLGALSIGGGIGLLAWSQKERRMEAKQGAAICPH